MTADIPFSFFFHSCHALENAFQETQDLVSIDHAVLDDDELIDLQYTSKQAAQDILT